MKIPLILVFASLLFRVLKEDVIRDFTDESYDFIVVGAGTSGCVVASRLSDNPKVKVLLLEAGISDLADPRIPIPINRFAFDRTQLDWNYTTYPQEHAFANNPERTMPYRRGKVLGGTSSVNYMVYVRGSPHDYDSWEDHGAFGWNFESLKPYFHKVENAQGEGMPESLGRNGRLKLTKANNSRTLLSDVMSNLAKNLGIKEGNYIDDLESMSYSIRTVYRGLRQHSATAYIRPFFPDRMKRLHIVSQALVTKILIDDNKKAYGVQYSKGGQLFTTFAKKEVILSAGAFATPHLLMLSGIGPQKELKSFNISVRSDLSGVGSNLNDHVAVNLRYKTDIKLPQKEDQKKQYILKGKGPLADDDLFYVAKRSKYFNTSKSFSNDKRPFPDIFTIALGQRSDAGNLTIIVAIFLAHPKSTGKINLQSTDPQILPIVDPKYYSDQDDLDVHVDGYRFVEEFETSDAFTQVGAKLIQPSACKHLFTPTVPRSEEFYKCLIKHSARHTCHACGTAKIGRPTDKWAVVDQNLRVYGVRNLRVADASVMPHMTTTNPQAPCYVIGEKAADMIKQDWELD